METVKSLRQKGYRVRVFHTRRWIVDPEYGDRVHERGGHTEVEIYQDETFVTSGTARCSNKENYDRKKGVRIALGRALDKMPFEF